MKIRYQLMNLSKLPDILNEDSVFWIPGGFGDLKKVSNQQIIAYVRQVNNRSLKDSVLMFMFKTKPQIRSI